MPIPLDAVFGFQRHIVAQVVEPELVVGAIQHVGEVGFLAGNLPQVLHPVGALFDRGVINESRIVLEAAHGKPQVVVDRPHPYRVAAGQVVVDRYHVDAPAGKGIEVHRQRGDQGLAFAGFHLGNLAPVEDNAPDELNVVVALAQVAAGRLPARRQRPREAGRPGFRLGPGDFGTRG